MKIPKVLLIGFGNPGRSDDGLGPALAQALEREELPGLTVDTDYQLTVEHAHDVCGHDLIIFADASMTSTAAYFFHPVDPTQATGFSSHSVSPETVMTLSRDLFAATPPAYILGIRGYRFGDIAEGLSDGAVKNLLQAQKFIIEWISKGKLTALEQ